MHGVLFVLALPFIIDIVFVVFFDSLLYDISNKILLIIILLCHCFDEDDDMYNNYYNTYSSAKFENALLLLSFLLVINFPLALPAHYCTRMRIRLGWLARLIRPTIVRRLAEVYTSSRST